MTPLALWVCSGAYPTAGSMPMPAGTGTSRPSTKRSRCWWMWTTVCSTGLSGGIPMAWRRSARPAVSAPHGAGPVWRPPRGPGLAAVWRWLEAVKTATPPIPATSATASTAAMPSRRRRSRRRRAACRARAASRRRRLCCAFMTSRIARRPPVGNAACRHLAFRLAGGQRWGLPAMPPAAGGATIETGTGRPTGRPNGSKEEVTLDAAMDPSPGLGHADRRPVRGAVADLGEHHRRARRPLGADRARRPAGGDGAVLARPARRGGHRVAHRAVRGAAVRRPVGAHLHRPGRRLVDLVGCRGDRGGARRLLGAGQQPDPPAGDPALARVAWDGAGRQRPGPVRVRGPARPGGDTRDRQVDLEPGSLPGRAVDLDRPAQRRDPVGQADEPGAL